MASRHLLARAISRTFLRSPARFPPPTGGGDGVAGRILPLGGRSGSSGLLARFGQVGHLSTQAGYYRHLAGGAGTVRYADRLRGWWNHMGMKMTFWSLFAFYMGSLVHILYKKREWDSQKYGLERVIEGDNITIESLEIVPEQIEALYQYAKFRFECDNFSGAAEYLYQHRALCTNSDRSFSASWGKLSA